MDFPASRAVVHHGSTGTTAGDLRAGVTGLCLGWLVRQSVFETQKPLKMDTTRRLSSAGCETLAADLRKVLDHHYAARTHEMAGRRPIRRKRSEHHRSCRRGGGGEPPYLIKRDSRRGGR